MRWPLKYQIMIPMSCLVVTTLILLSVANAWLAGRRVRQQIETQLRDIAETLTRSAFPLTGAVLAQMRGLSGVDFLVAAEDGTLIASSGDEPVPVEILAQPERSLPREITLSSRVRVNDSTFFHAALLLQRPFAHEEEGYLHFFYPEVNYQQAWWDAVLPPFLLGISALFLLVLLSLAIAQRVTRPIRRLRDGLEQIADGKFAQVIIPPRNDELQDLAVSVNRLAEKLSRYEEQVRRAERLRTLNQLGGGMAHQLRNSVTGCRMAVDLHRLGCPQRDNEELSVAIGQLEEMEGYLQRFLALGKQQETPRTLVEISELVARLLPLVELRCWHLKVELDWFPPSFMAHVHGDPDALGQMLLNLLMNAMEAAAEPHWGVTGEKQSPRVKVRVEMESASSVRLEVCDSGPGPAVEIRDKLFEPLVSGKRDGAGLGLPLSREIALSHGGSLTWERRDEMTCFRVILPLIEKETFHGDSPGC